VKIWVDQEAIPDRLVRPLGRDLPLNDHS
jgi:hypothetical protein